MAQDLQIPTEFGYTIFTAVAIILHYTILGFWTVKERRKVFKMDFLLKHHKESHKAAGIKIPAMGYPDYGCGIYSKSLSYKDWFNFNCALRVHQNGLELITSAVVSVLALGLFNPMFSVISGILYLVARIHYGFCYMNHAKGVEAAGLFSIAIIAANALFTLYNIFGAAF